MEKQTNQSGPSDTLDELDDIRNVVSSGNRRPANDGGGKKEFHELISSLVEEEPRTVSEVHSLSGETMGFSKDQTRHMLSKMGDTGEVNEKKFGDSNQPKIYWKD